MSFYKTPDNKLHFLEDDSFAYLLPDDAVQITQAEADSIRVAKQAEIAPTIYTCSPWQIRKALNAQGLRAAVESAVAASTDQALKDGWEFATEFCSNSPFVIDMGVALSKSPAEVTALIKYASTL